MTAAVAKVPKIPSEVIGSAAPRKRRQPTCMPPSKRMTISATTPIRSTLWIEIAEARPGKTSDATAALYTFGSTDSSISPNKNNCGNGFKNVSILTSPKAGTLNTANGGKVEGYFDGTGAGSGTQAVRMIVYSIDANNAPQTLLGVSAQQVI